MKIRFLKETKDIRPGAVKYHKKGKTYTMASVLGKRYINSGDGEDVDGVIIKIEKKDGKV